MARKHKLAAAARARAGKSQSRHPTHTLPTQDNSENDPNEVENAVESEYECGYTGGVNCEMTDGEHGTNERTDSSDEESLFEYTDKELEDNLGALRVAEAETLENFNAPMKFAMIMEGRSEKGWRNIEKNRKLGYSGTSQRTQQRRAKAARDQASFREAARTLCVLVF